jgi:hypothetical protein
MQRGLLVWALMILVLLAACQAQGTSTDPQAAQQLQPNIAGYTATSATNLVDVFTKAGSGVALSTGDAPLAAAIAKAGDAASCLQQSGAIDARTYQETSPSGVIPEVGVSMVINTTRVNQNLLSCLTRGTNQGFSAQSVTIEPCTGSGSFTFQSNNYTYLFLGVGDKLCGYFDQHFASIKANNQ